MGNPSYSSSSSSAYINSQGAGASSSSSASSPSGETSASQDKTFVPGANSASANASATATQQGVATSAQVDVPAGEQNPASDEESDDSDSDDSESSPADPSSANEAIKILFQIGTAASDRLENTQNQDLFLGSDGADTFVLGVAGATELNQADVVLDFDRASGDRLAFGEGLTVDNIFFEVADLNGDGTADSTAIRSSVDNMILGVIANSLSQDGQILISTADFAPGTTAEPNASSASEPNSTSSASSTSWVDDLGAGSTTTAIATSPSGETSSRGEESYGVGANSSSGSARAEASSQGVNTSASASTPAVEATLAQRFSTVQGTVIDFLTGTAENKSIVGGEGLDVMLGGEGNDTFVLSINSQERSQLPDIVVGFSADNGDRLQISGALSLDEITLEGVDLNGDGFLNGVSVGSKTTGEIYAVVFDCLDIAKLQGLLTIEAISSAPVLESN